MEKRKVRLRNPHAPKFCRKQYNTINQDFLERLREKHPEFKKNNLQDIRYCIRYFNQTVAEEIINNRYGIKLPEGLGVIVVGLAKLKTETAEKNTIVLLKEGTAEIVNINNDHSNQMIGKIKYTNEVEKHMFRNNNLWCFDATVPLKKALSAELKKEGAYNKYIVYTNKNHINTFFKSKDKKDKEIKEQMENTKEKLLKKHNEFEI